jgi:hypothetical protein
MWKIDVRRMKILINEEIKPRRKHFEVTYVTETLWVLNLGLSS